MKAISSDMILTSASTRADNSLGLRFSTPELAAQDKTVFFELLNKNLKVLIQPIDDAPEELHTVKSEINSKTPSMRLRATLFVWWKQQGEPGEFDEFYKRNMEKLIDYVKTKLNPT